VSRSDFVAPDGDLSGYRLVVAPNLYLVSDPQAANLRDFVAGGGHAVVTFFSGIVDQDDRVAWRVPGAFRTLLGVTVEEFSPLLPDQRVTLDSAPRRACGPNRLRCNGAEVIARYPGRARCPASSVTRNISGAGVAWYLATALEAGALRDLMRAVTQGAGVIALGPESDGTVEVVPPRRR